MRLICPNCGAQYEVDGSVIPDVGRDVQCSSCGHTWFQRKTAAESEDEHQSDEALASDPPEETTEIDEPGSPQPEEPTTTGVEEGEEASDDHDQQPSEMPERQPLDEDVAGILREEADLETTRRSGGDAAEVEAEESTTEPNVLANIQETIAQDRQANLHEPAIPETPKDDARSSVLPDIEEINSTLAAAPAAVETAADAIPEEQQHSSNFRRGFLIAILIFAILALIYVLAPRIADAVPATTGALTVYVDIINALRSAIDGFMLGIIDKMTGLLSQLNADQAG